MGKTLSVRTRTGVATIVAVAVAIAVPVAGQSPAAPSKASTASKVPRTPDGRPDLQGIWKFATLTPLQRPANLAGRTHLTDDEIAAIEARAGNRRETFGLFPDTANYDWEKRSSLVVDPPDGRVPPMTPFGAKRQAELHAARLEPENPENLPIYERCILGFNAGPPMIPGGYNQNVQLVQTRDYVVIHNEMNHNARIVPLDGRPRLPDHIRPWNGDSRGKWEGDTLVVTTTNFKSIGTGTLMLDGNRAALGIGWSPDENLTLTERFTRLDRDRMTYEWTMNDLTIWTKPWTVRMPLTRIDSNIFEYACHEGNHDFGFILAGQRKIEREGIKPAPKPVPGAKPR